MINPVALLFNNTFTVILSSSSSSYFNPILTITSLNNFSFFLLLGILTYIITLVNTSNLLLEDWHSGPPISALPFFSKFHLFLQLQAICLKLPQIKHFLSSITLSLFLFLLLSHSSCCLHSFSDSLSSAILISSILFFSLPLLLLFFSFLLTPHASFIFLYFFTSSLLFVLSYFSLS